jgi:peptide/nickel transport system permease protein
VLAYLIRRVLITIPLLLGILCLSFLMLKLAPGEPTIVQQDLQARATGAQRETLRQLYGLDKPIYVQFGRWLWRVVRLDFGRSYSPDGRPVLEKIAERIPITLGLNLLETVIIFALAVPLGILSATRQYSVFDKATTVFVFVGFATPDFWLALLVMILFGVQLGWLPISGLRSLNFEYLSFGAQVWDIAAHLVLPLLVASVGGLAGISLYMRCLMLYVMRM